MTRETGRINEDRVRDFTKHLAEEMEGRLREIEPSVRVYEVRVWESEGACAAWRCEEWK